MASGLALFVDGEFDAALSTASSFEIHERMGQPTRFALRYPLLAVNDDFPLAVDERIAPGVILSLRYQEDDQAKVLVEGPVTGHSLRFDHGGRDSHLEVLGADVSIAMDREVKSAAWSGAASDAVTAILANYEIRPEVSSTDGQHSESKHTLIQRDSDLRFIQRLARRNGLLFWVTHELTPLRSVASGHFAPPALAAPPAGTIRLNQEVPSALHFELRFDVERPSSLEGLQLNLNDKTTLDLGSASSPLGLLGASDLRAITGDTRSVHVTAPVDDSAELLARGKAALIDAGWFVQATCESTRQAFGSVLRAHTVVDVRGLGTRHSGLYFVAGVRHLVDSSAHRMLIELLRNAWGG